MAMTLLVSIFISLTIITPALQTNKEDVETNEIEDPELKPKIINGRDARDGEFPWMVALHYNDRFICSSFLISPTIVMTAAHCVILTDSGVAEPANSFSAITGNVARNGPEQRITFLEVAAHPDYDERNTDEYDIAVLRTSGTVVMNERVQSVCIPVAGRMFDDLREAQAMGWGITRNGDQEPAQILQTASLPVVPRNLCGIIYGTIRVQITERHVCAGLFHQGICFGDSGGPLVSLNDSGSRPVAIGIASFVSMLGCARPFVPGVYTAISAYIDWLTETVQDVSEICFV